MVQRYAYYSDPLGYCFCEFKYDADGSYVSYEEYKKLEKEKAAQNEKLAAHAEVVEAAKGVIESARLWSSQNYPTFDRIELEVTEALAAALAKLEEAVK